MKLRRAINAICRALMGHTRVVVLIVAACSRKPPPPPLIDFAAITSALAPGDAASAAVAKLRAERATMSEADRAFADRVLDAVDAAQRDPDHPEQHFATLQRLLRDGADLHGDNAEWQTTATATFGGLAFMAPSFGADPAAIRSEYLTRARKLVATFPDEGRAYGVLADALAQSGAGDDLEVARTYKTCVDHHAPGAYCATMLDRYREQLTAVRCDGVSPALGFYSESQSGTRESTPLLTANDIASITRADDHAVAIVLTPAGTAKLEDRSGAIAKADGSLAIVLGSETLMAPRLREPIVTGMLHLTAGADPVARLLERLCVKVMSPVLPSELRP